MTRLTRNRSASCAGKEAFTTANLAHQVAERRARFGKRGVTYRCDFCGHWHIGAKQPDVSSARRRKFIEESRA